LFRSMDLDMWIHPATQKNIETLKQYHTGIIPVGSGELASGLSGEGRMAEPEEIMTYLHQYFNKKKTDLAGNRVLITAGPTYEPIDPVRFIGNHSSGKMGLELAKECKTRGAEVDLVIGPNHLDLPIGINIRQVTSAAEMEKNVMDLKETADILIFSAAVADYTPSTTESRKIKKKETNWQLNLTKTTDIAAKVGADKKEGQILVGFALETDHETENAFGKLTTKNLDLIVLNSLNDEGAGFTFDTNKISILHRLNNKIEHFELKSKSQVATDIIDRISELLHKDG
ncbi:MAG TPA: bifunctional phosphopantothenoylcysteine decarboxylase/phosphopantothenate--cysteine ligase CoaBC, partial [Saprospirales bacterium]|nr:bifunctional phosphopantothenoylcysteine decarboxylase/phosphopantothenate--cysteine ligase CoaBC [Saprospirales bacterium]